MINAKHLSLDELRTLAWAAGDYREGPKNLPQILERVRDAALARFLTCGADALSHHQGYCKALDDVVSLLVNAHSAMESKIQGGTGHG